MRKRWYILAAVCLGGGVWGAPKYTFRCERVPESGFANPGDKISFVITLLADRKPADLPFSRTPDIGRQFATRNPWCSEN